MKEIGILGSTGSVGTQALDVIRSHPDKFKVKYLVGNENIELLTKQAIEFNPEYVCIINNKKYKNLKKNLKNKNVISGRNSLIDLCSMNKIDIVLNAISGYEGLEPTISIINAGVDIALANKESIVQAGHLVIPLAKKNNVNILPVDSEHSALWQCLVGEKRENIKKLLLTASGGPFRTLNKNKFSNITKKDALNHPNWNMGEKITIDSATMMNKGFEVIEACWLFNIDVKKIKILVHPQSIIHSMVEFIDGTIKAQLSIPDMRQPIQYAFTYPNRLKIDNMKLDFNKFSRIDFEPVNLDKFKCISLAYDAIKFGGTYSTVLNVSNDIAVKLFLKEKISFIMIPKLIKDAMDKHQFIDNPSIEDIKEITSWTEKFILNKYDRL